MRHSLSNGAGRVITPRTYESTEVGEQSLIDGVRPFDGQTVSQTVCLPVSPIGEKLTAQTSHPMTPKRNPHAGQKPCDHGLFDGEGQERAPVERSPPNAVLCPTISNQTKLNQQWRLP